MPSRETSRGQKWSLYPQLHNRVVSLLQEDHLSYRFNTNDDDKSCIRSYDTNIMGRFVCHNKACRAHGWSSKMIPITIRLYHGQRYNARVYHQQCASCQLLSKPMLDNTYAERIAYRIKRWAGVDIEAPSYIKSENKRPHRSSLCEGCKAGHCKQLQG